MGLTLSQVPTRLHIDGDWPGSISIRRGWAKAVARPWNDELPHGSLRLIRGGRDFLSETAVALADMAGGHVFSPALYPSASGVWKKAGFTLNSLLDVMERRLGYDVPTEDLGVTKLEHSRLEEMKAVEEAAFDPFWRMSVDGLVEAYGATPRSVVFVTHDEHRVATGYAITGAQSGVSFLQRIAVSTKHSGAGLGTALVQASFQWARRQGARTMILNVRPGNPAARRLYQKNGFTMTGTALELLEFKG